jgi:DNA polymerase III alpha subunit (gram-positive type)
MNKEADRYVSVDIEASGQIPWDYSMLSIGACLVTRPEVRFYVEIQPLNDNIEDWPAKNLSELVERCRTKGLAPKYAMEKFEAWLGQHVKGKPIFVGFNANFDASYVYWYFWHFLKRNPFVLTPIEIKAVYMGKFGKNWHETTKRNVKSTLGVSLRHTHMALDDAIEQAAIMYRLLEI